MAHSSKIVLTTFGSLGDLHPYIALALGLQARGHRPVIATGRYYQEKVEGEGIAFSAVRPDFPDREAVKQLVRDVLDMQKGPQTVIRDVVLPHLRDSYEDLLQVATGADLLVTSMLTYAGPIAADKLRMLWISSVLQPSALLSLYDDLELAPAPWLSHIRRAAPPVYRALLRMLIRSTSSWAEPIRRLRQSEGLSPKSNLLFQGSQSPYLVLAMFSRLLCEPMPDWPPNTTITGFAFHDRNAGVGLEPDLEAFLAAGPSPIVFTLGSSAVMDAGRFYEESALAAKRLGMRALLLIGDERENRPSEPPSDRLGVFRYAPYSDLFPRCAAVVHQGGVGTTGQALRSGRPMLVMPYGQDQPDNAARVVRLGAARTIARRRYNSQTAADELRMLLNESSYAESAEKVGKVIQRENGVAQACDKIEGLLARSRAG